MLDHILVGDLDGALDLVDKLKQENLAASCDTPSHPVHVNEPCEAIWVGGSVTPDVAITAIRTAIAQWPFLKYVHLSCDVGSYQPDSVHYQVFVGGSTATALEHNCRPWSPGDFERLECGMPLPVFHYYVRSFYNRQIAVATLVRFCGGPWDGQVINMEGPPEAVPRTWTVARTRYQLRKVGNSYEYHPASVTGEVHPDEVRDPGIWEKHQAEVFREKFGQDIVLVFKKGGGIEEEHVYDSRSCRQEDLEAIEMTVGLVAHDKRIGPNIIGRKISRVFPWRLKELMGRREKKLSEEERSRFWGITRFVDVSVDAETGVTTIYMESDSKPKPPSSV